MIKLVPSAPWLEEVEAVEEQLEALKLAAWRPVRAQRSRASTIVQSTAGLLGKRMPPGPLYERRLRRAWERASRQRTA